MKKLLLTLLAILVIAPAQSAPLFYGNITYQKLEPYLQNCVFGTYFKDDGKTMEGYGGCTDYKTKGNSNTITVIVDSSFTNRSKNLENSMFISHRETKVVSFNKNTSGSFTYLLDHYGTPATIIVRSNGENYTTRGKWVKGFETNTGIVFEIFDCDGYIHMLRRL